VTTPIKRNDFMSTETPPPRSAEAPAIPAQGTPTVPASVSLNEPTPIPESWKPLFAELTTYYQYLPELLTAGEAGRFVVVHGNELSSTWDSYRDANQYGSERFGDQLFMVHQVDPRDVERLARFFPTREAVCPARAG
jgi:hypothetical protein